MKLDVYVNYPGSCEQAFGFYAEHLGGTITLLSRHGDAPGPSNVPPDWARAVLHARLELGGSVLMGADIPNAQPMRSAYLTLTVASEAEAERIYTALADGGRVLMPLQETFFATRFGQVQDQFGINWMVICERVRP